MFGSGPSPRLQARNLGSWGSGLAGRLRAPAGSLRACLVPFQAPPGPCPVRGCSMKLRSADHTLLNNDMAAAAREHYALVGGNSDPSGTFWALSARTFQLQRGFAALTEFFSFSAANFTTAHHTRPHQTLPHHTKSNPIESSKPVPFLSLPHPISSHLFPLSPISPPSNLNPQPDTLKLALGSGDQPATPRFIARPSPIKNQNQ